MATLWLRAVLASLDYGEQSDGKTPRSTRVGSGRLPAGAGTRPEETLLDLVILDVVVGAEARAAQSVVISPASWECASISTAPNAWSNGAYVHVPPRQEI